MNRLEGTTQIAPIRSNIALSEEIIALRAKLFESPHNSQLWFELGMTYPKQLLYREAVEAMAMCLIYEPNNQKAYRNKGEYNLRIGRYGDAAADLASALRLNPYDAEALYWLGLAYYLSEHWGWARDAFIRCKALSNDNYNLQNSAALWLADCVRREKHTESDLYYLSGFSKSENSDVEISFLYEISAATAKQALDASMPYLDEIWFEPVSHSLISELNRLNKLDFTAALTAE